MFFKIIGATIVVITSYILGCSKAYEYKNRVKYLQSMYSCLFQLENEIRYTQTPLAIAFKKISGNSHPLVKNMFEYAAEKFDESIGELLSETWEKVVARYSYEIAEDDLDLILSFGTLIGNSDIEGQLKNIELFKERIRGNLKKAEEECNVNNKMFKNAGLYIGILIAVFFI